MDILHLRINNAEGRLVGVLDVPEDKMPDDFKKLEKQVQEKFSIPVSVEPRVNAITRIS